ncbi:15-cis-phytoene synthase CrtB [Prochlorothrix hollandica]|uniref:15-cis-phytoene synthase n=1 Tax=Prochlorothrix hollandica PCC 9006 = CALU 1027 TaxID=317619 RepID=A0A0M2PVQ2_PROHO|nr:phytoene synthase [Prochlorothrix hollandica]KKJ00521.1 phytoene synthase [Prochlorothrix hollandica PCC 9006 = CALU 1027]
MLQLTKPSTPHRVSLAPVEEAYEICRRITADYAKTFYLGTMLMPAAKRKAIWAIYVWCRHTDELVDGPKAATTTLETLDQWERELESIFAGVPIHDWDVALVDTLQQFPLDIQPFRDMIEGQRMDLHRSRYQTFEELELYCYRVAGTVGLMSTTVMGVEPHTSLSPWLTPEAASYVPVQEAVTLGIANQLTNILRDVGEDARRRGRIYLPLDELAQFNYTEDDLVNGVIDDRWRAFMRFQLDRARYFYQEAERGIGALSRDGRWPVWASLMLYSQILDVIEENDYDVFNRRAYVPNLRKFMSLPVAWTRAIAL